MYKRKPKTEAISNLKKTIFLCRLEKQFFLCQMKKRFPTSSHKMCLAAQNVASAAGTVVPHFWLLRIMCLNIITPWQWGCLSQGGQLQPQGTSLCV
jgi:hypothetical protein